MGSLLCGRGQILARPGVTPGAPQGIRAREMARAGPEHIRCVQHAALAQDGAVSTRQGSDGADAVAGDGSKYLWIFTDSVCHVDLQLWMIGTQLFDDQW